MIPRTIFCASVLMLAGGCAIPAEPSFGNNHPASPQAVEAPVSAVSQTLASDNAAAPVTDAMPNASMPTKPGDEMDHSRMKHSDMPGMKHDGHDMPEMKHDMPSMQPGGSAAPPASKPAATAAPYTCVMHPEVVAAAPGKCPKCGMKLVAKKN